METARPIAKSNRRVGQRRKPRTYVKLQCRRGNLGLGPDLAASLLDISDSGVRLIVKEELQLRGEVEVIISAHGLKDLVKRLGNVRWQVKLETGLFCVGIQLQKHLPYRDWQYLASPS